MVYTRTGTYLYSRHSYFREWLAVESRFIAVL